MGFDRGALNAVLLATTAGLAIGGAIGVVSPTFAEAGPVGAALRRTGDGGHRRRRARGRPHDHLDPLQQHWPLGPACRGRRCQRVGGFRGPSPGRPAPSTCVPGPRSARRSTFDAPPVGALLMLQRAWGESAALTFLVLRSACVGHALGHATVMPGPPWPRQPPAARTCSAVPLRAVVAVMPSQVEPACSAPPSPAHSAAQPAAGFKAKPSTWPGGGSGLCSAFGSPRARLGGPADLQQLRLAGPATSARLDPVLSPAQHCPVRPRSPSASPSSGTSIPAVARRLLAQPRLAPDSACPATAHGSPLALPQTLVLPRKSPLIERHWSICPQSGG